MLLLETGHSVDKPQTRRYTTLWKVNVRKLAKSETNISFNIVSTGVSDWVERLVSEMTYVLMGMLNHTHSLTHSFNNKF